MPEMFGAPGERGFCDKKNGEGDEDDAEPEDGDVPLCEVQPNSGTVLTSGVAPDPDGPPSACAASFGDDPFPLALPSGETVAGSSGLPSSGSDSAESGYISPCLSVVVRW